MVKLKLLIVALFLGLSCWSAPARNIIVQSKPLPAPVAAPAPHIVQTPPVSPAVQQCKERPCIHAGGIFGAITPKVAEEIIGFLKNADEKKADAVVLGILSPGGDCDASDHIFDAIKESPVPVYCYVRHMAASGAFWILQACKERAMEEDARLMVHAPFIMAKADMAMKRTDLVEALSKIDMMQDLMVTDIAPRMKMTSAALVKRLGEGDWFMSASQAVKSHAIDIVVPRDIDFSDYYHNVAGRFRKK